MMLIEEAQKIFSEEGIRVEAPTFSHYRNNEEWEAQCYKGIKNFESKEYKVKDQPPSFKGFEARKNVGWIKVGRINFIQLKDVKEDGFYLR